MNMRKNPILLLTIAVLVFGLSQSIYAQLPQSCSAPGLTVVSDPNELLTFQYDIDTISVAEPFYSNGDNKFVITLKVQGLAPLPLGSWNVFITGPDNVQRFVQMSTLLGNPQYRYGTVTYLLGLPIFNYEGDIQGTFSSDGSIRFVIDRSRLGNPANGSSMTVSGRTFIRPLLDLVLVDQTAENAYTVAGSGGCTPYKFANWGALGDVPLTGNFNRNARADFTVWRRETNTWYTIDPFTSEIDSFQFGNTNLDDIPVAGDFDTDNRNDWVV